MGKQTTRLFQVSLGVAFASAFAAGCGSADSGALFTSSGHGSSLASGGASPGSMGGFVGLLPSAAGGAGAIAAGGFAVSHARGGAANLAAGGGIVPGASGAHAT